MKYVIILLNLFLLVACTRTASDNKTSLLKFDFSKVQYKNSVLTNNFPETTEICYGVNITAPDITSRNLSCGPTLGLTAGFVPSGSDVSIEVPSGEKRTIDLYMYLPTTGEGCPSTENSKIDTTQLFKVSSKSNVTLNTSEVTLEMPVEFPGYDHSMFDDLNLPLSCLEGNDPNNPPPVINPNAPKIISASFNNNSFTSVGVDETLTLSLLVKAVYSPNWLNINYYGPSGNISGGGSAQMFYTCTASYSANPSHICFGYDETYYFASKSFLISQWMQNGNYFMDLNVQDSMYFQSESSTITYSVANHPATSAPVISNLLITPDASLSSGSGGNVVVNIAVSSVAPPNYLFKTLNRPDGSAIYGGGSMVSFSSCSGNTANVSHVCYGQSVSDWYTTFSDYLSMFAQNGTYNYVGIQVQNAAMLNSSPYAAVSFSISGNTPAWTPAIYLAEAYYVFDDSAINYGIPYYNGSCVIASQGSNLSLGIKLFANTNAPLNYLNYNISGPLGNISGGGLGVGSTNVGANQYRVDFEYYINNIPAQPRGNFSWNSITVSNEGVTPSSPVGPYSLNVQDSCPTYYSTNTLSSKTNSTCAITNLNNIKCWGSNALNIIDHGFNGTLRSYPTLVLGNNNFLDIAIGSSHTCAIDSTNHLFCWGDNTYGQLGNGTSVSSSVPLAIDSGNQYSRISVGSTHTCGITFSGSLKCWGLNTNGQLGDGTTVSKTSPTLIDSGVIYFNVKLGNQHSCGITNSAILKCWGNNSTGQLGDGTTTQKITPTVIDAGTYYMNIATGALNTCGTTTSSVLKCWGNNTYGQIGDGTTTARTSPTLIDSGVSYSQVSIASSHACGVTVSNALKCWGNNTYGQLGNGTFSNSLFPVNIGTTYSQIVTGSSHSCGIKTDGHLFCWGDNTYGQLGKGSGSASNLPVPVDQ